MVSESLPASASLRQDVTSSAPSSIYCSPALEDAWRRFGDYDKNANIAQDRFLRQRQWVIGLGVIVTALAVFDLRLEQSLQRPDHWLTIAIANIVTPIGLDVTAVVEGLDSFLNVIIIIIPILISILVAGAVKFNMGINWVMLRSASESIKREIFRYRTQVDIYNPQHTGSSGKSESRDVTLARKIKQVSKRVMETQVNMSELEIYDYKKEGLPPVYGVAPGDDGFSDLTAEQYVHWRIEDQFDYYRRKAKQLAKELQQFQWMVYLFGGLGTLLAATEMQIWVAVTSAVVAALSSFLEFKRLETNLISCNIAASDLYDIRAWWRALPDSAKQLPSNTETLVKSTEAVIQGENASWLTEMREALSEIYSDSDAEGDGHGVQRIAVLPESFTTGSVSAASASSAFDAVVKGRGGGRLSSLREAIASSLPDPGAIPSDTLDGEANVSEVASDLSEASRSYDQDAIDEGDISLAAPEGRLNGSTRNVTAADPDEFGAVTGEEPLVATPPSQDEIMSQLPSVGIDPDNLTATELASIQQSQNDEEIDLLSETGGVFIEEAALAPDPYVREEQPSEPSPIADEFISDESMPEESPIASDISSTEGIAADFNDLTPSGTGGVFIEVDDNIALEPYVRGEGDVQDTSPNTNLTPEEFGSEETGGVFIEIDRDITLEPYTRPEGDLPQDYEDDLKALDSN